MSSKRRFTEKEIAQIFEEATRAQNEAADNNGSIDGLSLEELKQIGASTGIDPKYIARAAIALNKRPQYFPVRRHLGIPIGVARSIELPEMFSDRDWEQLVVDLRKTFKARGKIKQEGSLREWSNGNLHALVEPTATGFELRLETKKGNMMGLLYAGIAYIFTSFFMFASLMADADATMNFAILMAGLFCATGIGMISSVALTQPRWARKREQQMEAICKRAVFLGKEVDEDEEFIGQLESSPNRFLSLEDEEKLNEQLKQFARRTSRT